jgi:hypothetical protein
MIQEDRARTKAFRQIVEPLRALRGIISVVKSVVESRRNPRVGAIHEVMLAMFENSAVRVKIRAWICILATLILGFTLSARRAAAQADAGPQAGATPSDQPTSSPKPRAVAQIGGHPSLAGNWTLNKDQSDDPRQKMREAMGNSGNGPGAGGGGGTGGGGGFGGGGGRRGGGQGGGRGQGDMNAEFSQLAIVQTATSAKVTGSSGRVLAVYDSSKSSGSSDSGTAGNSNDASNSDSSETGGRQNAPAAAAWQGTQLVAVTQGRRGGSTTRTYELSPDGSQLYVTTKIDNPRFQQPVTYRFVYDATKSNGGGSQ